jgi:hypothetical protein
MTEFDGNRRVVALGPPRQGDPAARANLRCRLPWLAGPGARKDRQGDSTSALTELQGHHGKAPAWNARTRDGSWRRTAGASPHFDPPPDRTTTWVKRPEVPTTSPWSEVGRDRIRTCAYGFAGRCSYRLSYSIQRHIRRCAWNPRNEIQRMSRAPPASAGFEICQICGIPPRTSGGRG